MIDSRVPNCCILTTKASKDATVQYQLIFTVSEGDTPWPSGYDARLPSV